VLNPSKQPHSRVLCFGQLALLLLALVAPVLAASEYRFDTWTTDNGLPQGSVNSIRQTRDGFIWMTTFGGLVRYDGLRFQVFNTGNTKGLRASRFSRLEEDGQGNLWMSTEGQGVTRYKDGVFTTFTTENGLPDNFVQQIEIDSNGDMILDFMGRILRWNGETFVDNVPSTGEPNLPPLHRLKNGGWYFENSRLRKYENGQLTVDYPTDLVVLRAMEDSKGRLWIAADQKDFLYMLKDGKLSEYHRSDGFPEFRMGIMTEDSSGQLWFGASDGVYQFDGQKFTRYTTADGLVRGLVTSIFQDREGTLWVGTSGGLSRLTRRTITTYSAADGLAHDNVYPIYEDADGKIWIGSWAGLSSYENGVFQNIGHRHSADAELMMSILRDTRGNLWLGGWSGLVMPPENHAPKPGPNILTGMNVRAIYEDRAGNVWFGTSVGLVKFDGRVYISYSHKEGLPAKGVFVIREDRAGTLWIGTESGLVAYRNGQFNSITERLGAAGNIVRSIYEDAEGTLWIGMYDSGIYRFKNDVFTHYTTENGLFDNGAFSMVEDDQGNFWISCNLGIYRVRKADFNDVADGRIGEVTSILYNKRDGMLNSECNGGGQNAGLRARDGRIWFPTQQGVAVIDPQTIPLNPIPPPVVIESLVIDTKTVDQYKKIEIQPEQSSLEIHYSGLSFINPELVKFKYKLEGLDPEWIDAQTRRTAYYSHIPPGNYTFKVLAANRDGVWNEQGAILSLAVLPPFWRTWWFLVLASIGVTLIIFTLYRRRINMLTRAHAAQEAFALKLIESQERERKRIAAELHDSLGQSLVLIKNWALLAIQAYTQKRSPKANLDEISETASEAIKEVREISYNLGPYQLDRLGLKKTIEEMIQKVDDSSPTKFILDIGEIDGCLARDAEVSFFRIVQEALNNVVKHAAATEASLGIGKEGGHLVLTIRDDGNGFDAARSESGFGLVGMSERVGLLRGEISVRSEIGKGTSVRVRLPCTSNNG
jgi:signal transduction histidine kinase/ligand-binding sensor domain-containing protein